MIPEICETSQLQLEGTQTSESLNTAFLCRVTERCWSKKEETELDGKEQRRGTEGERVARKEGKENEVEKDVTGWTE